jgi:hypothetical protein
MFKMAFRLSDKLVLMMLSSLFEDDYDWKEVTVEYGNTEFIGDHLERLYSDLEITVNAGNLIRNYHIEFQTQNDRSMVIRMFRYGFEKSRELFKTIEGRSRIRLEFPKQLVIFLEENSAIDDFLDMDIILPNADIITYQVPVLKLWEYDLNSLKRKNLYLLIPFKVIDFRKNIQNILSGSRPEVEKKRLIMAEFERMLATIKEIALIVGDLYNSKEINAYDLEQMLLIINNLTEYLYQKYSDYQEKPLNEEVGKMLTTLINPAILEKGREEGIKEGIKEGEKKGKLDDAKNMLMEGLGIPLIVKITGLPEEEILKLTEKPFCEKEGKG